MNVAFEIYWKNILECKDVINYVKFLQKLYFMMIVHSHVLVVFKDMTLYLKLVFL